MFNVMLQLQMVLFTVWNRRPPPLSSHPTLPPQHFLLFPSALTSITRATSSHLCTAASSSAPAASSSAASSSAASSCAASSSAAVASSSAAATSNSARRLLQHRSRRLQLRTPSPRASRPPPTTPKPLLLYRSEQQQLAAAAAAPAAPAAAAAAAARCCCCCSTARSSSKVLLLLLSYQQQQQPAAAAAAPAAATVELQQQQLLAAAAAAAMDSKGKERSSKRPYSDQRDYDEMLLGSDHFLHEFLRNELHSTKSLEDQPALSLEHALHHYMNHLVSSLHQEQRPSLTSEILDNNIPVQIGSTQNQHDLAKQLPRQHHDGHSIPILEQPHSDPAIDKQSILGTVRSQQSEDPLQNSTFPEDSEDDIDSEEDEDINPGKKWREFKTRLKKHNYDPYKTYQERIAHRDDRVAPNEWEYLIKYWSSEVGQERCAKNKTSRAKQTTTHTSGTKSFARVRAEGQINEISALYSDIAGKKASRMTFLLEYLEKISEIQFAVTAWVLLPQNNKQKARRRTYIKEKDMQHNEILDTIPVVVNANVCPKEPSWNEVSSLQSSYEIPQNQDGSEVYLKSLKKPHNNVAQGTLLSKDPKTKVGGVELGPQCWEIQIDIPIIRVEPLLRSYKGYRTIGDAVGASVAWPFTFIKRK
uniref:Transposase Tnp1/En/Spm-like domain-containing protein n=1 Tax=Ananas comosus var. bracteatus TaxID=296719 RepID=A0A6V7PDE5_ANACO|nr:unnamed protein product [Ananas comosus var. bracteatus]